MAVFMWRWVYGSLDADQYDTIEAAASAEAHNSDSWSCVGVEVVEGGESTWMPLDEPGPFKDALDAAYAKIDAAFSVQMAEERKRPVTGIVRVSPPAAGDFKTDRWARLEWVHDRAEEAEAVAKLSAIFGADRVSVERPKVGA